MVAITVIENLIRQQHRSQWWSPEAIVELQLQRLRELLVHCQREVPYYREALAGIDPMEITDPGQLARLPLLSRAVFQQQADAFHARALPSGVRATGELSTSGSTGEPVVVLQTDRVQAQWLADFVRELDWAGVDIRGRLAAIRPLKGKDPVEQQRLLDGITQPHWHPTLARLRTTGQAHAMDLHQRPDRQLHWLQQLAPDYLLSFPSNLLALAELIHDGAPPPVNLKCILTLGETLEADARARITAAFGVAVLNTYSCYEAGYVASTCPEGHGLHVHAENVILELLDDGGRPVPAGTPGEVVLTPLHNHRSPLIRYRIRDTAVLSPEPCPCGRGLPLLTRVEGKMRPLFVLPDGHRKNSAALIMGLRKLGRLRQYQVIQQALDRLRYRLVAGPDWGAEQERQVRDQATDFLGARVTVDFEYHRARLPLPPGGKLLDAVCEAAPTPGVVPGPRMSRPTVLLGWELGAGLGHLHSLKRIAEAGLEQGWQPVFVSRDVAGAEKLLAGLDIPVHAAPDAGNRPPSGQQGFLAASYADILSLRGFDDADELERRVAAWERLLAELDPALVISDHSPTLNLAARDRTPLLLVGNGFILPAPEPPAFPLLVPGRQPYVAEATLLTAVNTVRSRRGRVAWDRLPALFDAPRVVTVLPLLDPYRSFRRELPVGPLEVPLQALPPPAGERWFAYLSGEVACTEPVLTVLARSGVPGTAYVRDADETLKDRLRSAGVTLQAGLRPMEEILAGAAVVVHHGNAGMCQAALGAGRAQLLCPPHMEHRLYAGALSRLGVALVLDGQYTGNDVVQSLARLLREPGFAQRAREQAQALARAGPWRGLARVMERAGQLLNGNPNVTR